ncbi:MAG: IS110 family transposase [Bacillota bacterium]
MDRSRLAFIGVDPHKFQHTAVVINCWNQVLGTVSTRNHPDAFPGFLQTLLGHVPQGYHVVFGLEDCHGYGRHLASFLLNAGFVVKSVTPIQANRERSRRARPEKSDPVDARNIACVMIQHLDSLPDAVVDEVHLSLAHVTGTVTAWSNP